MTENSTNQSRKTLGRRVVLNQLQAESQLEDVTLNDVSLFAGGKMFYGVMDYVTAEFNFVSSNAASILAVPADQVTASVWLQRWHPEDFELIQMSQRCQARFMADFVDSTEIMNYKMCQKYRLRQEDGSYRQFLNQITPLSISDRDELQRALLVQTDITHLGQSINHRLSFIHMYGGPSFYSDDFECFVEEGTEELTLSERERNILRLIAMGKRSQEIADELYISRHTVDTHRRNILTKTECGNMSEVVCSSIRNGWI